MPLARKQFDAIASALVAHRQVLVARKCDAISIAAVDTLAMKLAFQLKGSCGGFKHEEFMKAAGCTDNPMGTALSAMQADFEVALAGHNLIQMNLGDRNDE